MKRYTDERTGRRDGVHLYGSSGRNAYTKSVLNILNKTISPSQYSEQPPTPTPSVPPPSSAPEDPAYHSSCPQAQYINGNKNMNNGNKKMNNGTKNMNNRSKKWQ